MGTGHLITVAVGAAVTLAQARKQLFQSGVKVFPAALSQRQPHAKAEDPPYTGFFTAVQQGGDILLGIVDKRQNGGKPHHRGNAGLLQFPQYLTAAGGSAHIRFQLAAQRLISCGQGHL